MMLSGVGMKPLNDIPGADCFVPRNLGRLSEATMSPSPLDGEVE